ncbi:transglycosylase SLT domain-containing protein [bacterium]|nr:transglycosylase SLT domain-containing protein [bacterium]
MKNLIIILSLALIPQLVYAHQIEYLTDFENEVYVYEDEISSIKHCIKFLIKDSPRHSLNRNKSKLQHFAESILLTSYLYSDVHWAVILGIAYTESTLRPKIRGDIGERGVMQVHGAAWQHCRERLSRLDKTNIEHQLICGTLWFSHMSDLCDGSTFQGMSMYMTGKICKPKKNGKLYSQVSRRLRIIKKIRKIRYDTYDLEKLVY